MTAEVALAMPGLLLVAFVLILGVVLAGQQIRCRDAASALARAVARGEPAEVVDRLAADSMPSGARVRTDVVEGLVHVRVEWRLPASAGPAARFAPAVVAEAVAQVEP